MSYQPGIPTGTVNLDTDYLNIQNNFTSLNTQFGIDHVPFSDPSGTINGFHEDIHFNPVSTTATNPPNNYPPTTPAATPGFGQLFSPEVNDGLSIDTSLYYLSGGGRLSQLTRNFQPVANQNGRTFLPGGMIIQWFFVANPADDTNISYPLPFPTACYSIQLTPIMNDNSTVRCYIKSGSVNATNFRIRSTSSSGFVGMYVTAIGI